MASEASKILDSLEGILRDSATLVLEGAQDDLERFAEELTRDLATASLLGDVEGVEDILEQSKAIAELNMLRASDTAWDTFLSLAGQATSLVTLLVRYANGVVL